MKVLVVEYGFIGERHARVLNSLGLEVAMISLGLERRPSRQGEFFDCE